LVVQRLTFIDGNSQPTGVDTADGGGAIYRNGGSLTVMNCSFINNDAPSSGPDLAGGAIYGFGGGETIIVDSTFTGNTASDGGAVGSLNSDLTIINSTFTQNSATGTGGNPGQGGCGGAVYMDGNGEKTILCGVTIANNQAGAIGGGIFRVSNNGTGTFTMDNSTIDSNLVTPASSGNAGGLYLQGLVIEINNSTISRNQAFYNGGIWLHTSQVQITNTTIAENIAFGSNGGGLWLSNNPTGTLLNCTIANNKSTATDQIAGAIFGSGLTLTNTLIANNSAMWVSNCSTTHDDGGNNIQWPTGSLCTEDITVIDPLLGTLGYHGGPTETLMPAYDSPGRNSGTDCPSIDQRGQPRNQACTIGAVEIK
jgi:parallel beta-helix repeat protein